MLQCYMLHFNNNKLRWMLQVLGDQRCRLSKIAEAPRKAGWFQGEWLPLPSLSDFLDCSQIVNHLSSTKWLYPVGIVLLVREKYSGTICASLFVNRFLKDLALGFASRELAIESKKILKLWDTSFRMRFCEMILRHFAAAKWYFLWDEEITYHLQHTLMKNWWNITHEVLNKCHQKKCGHPLNRRSTLLFFWESC